MDPPHLAARLSAVLVGAGGLFVLVSLASFHPADVALFSSDPNLPTRNIGGVIGAWIAVVGRAGFGWAAFGFPLVCGVWAVSLWQGQSSRVHWASRVLSLIIFMMGLATVLAVTGADPRWQSELGGLTGYLAAQTGQYYLGTLGLVLLAGCVSMLAWTLVVDQPTLPFRLWRRLWAWPMRLWQARRAAPSDAIAARPQVRTVALPGSDRRVRPVASARVSSDEPMPEPDAQATARIRSSVVPKPKVLAATLSRARHEANGGFQLPGLDLLATPPPMAERQLKDDVQRHATILEETLREFGVEAQCVNIDRGPTVTRYELAPAPGVKLTKIISLADELALVLKTASCHVVAPIPGKGLVGIDVPNSTATIVYLKEILTSRAYQQIASALPLGIGKDVSGHPLVVDLRECPHLLIAGATGSGKTVCLNSVLTGLLCHATPEDVKFLMIDPKMVELVLFNDIPHLVAPVVTDAKRAGAALSWAVHEMERRYQVLAKAGVRNIDMYNQRVLTGASNGETQRMPYLVIVIDELADLMLIASQDVEEAITRLSQLSRAVGLHIILATQRPSVDVITGVIKANFPARIAFQVASKVDSRTILDVNGADKLLGRGDLLFLRPGTAKPIRAQSCLVTDAEIERVVSHLKAQRPPVFDEQLIARQEKPAAAFDTEKDELYDMAKKIVLETGQASTSFLQRRLRLGYGRAARILDLMEQEGLVGPPQGSRPREILAAGRPPTNESSS